MIKFCRVESSGVILSYFAIIYDCACVDGYYVVNTVFTKPLNELAFEFDAKGNRGD